jgi:hypothetical protein
MAAVVATVAALLLAFVHPCEPTGLEWSSPTLVEDFTYPLPVPDHFYAFDDGHMYGMGANGSWAFSGNGGKAWSLTHTPSNVPHGAAAMLAVNTTAGRTAYRSLGGGVFPDGEGGGWTLQWPREYSMLPDGSGFAIEVAEGGVGPNHNVTFSGVPAPGVNTSAQALIKSGTRNFGVVKAANGDYVVQTDILWNGLPTHEAHGTTFVMSSIVSFTSADGWDWKYGGIIANWSSVSGNMSDPPPGDVLHPLMWGPSEIDLTLLADNTTLLSVVRMDGDAGCFSGDVPPVDRNAEHTTCAHCIRLNCSHFLSETWVKRGARP